MKYFNIISIKYLTSYTQCGGKTSPRPFSEKSKLSISLNQHSEISYSLFFLHVQVKVYRNILKLKCRSLAFNSCKASF